MLALALERFALKNVSIQFNGNQSQDGWNRIVFHREPFQLSYVLFMI